MEKEPSLFQKIMANLQKGWLWLWQRLCYLFRRFQIWRWLLLMFLTCFLAMSAFFTYKAKTVNISDLKSSLSTFTTIYDHNNNKVGELYADKGTYVGFNEISPAIKNAVISTEDRTFYTNPGFSIKGILRAIVSYVVHHGEILSGGSTITQQLAKNMLLTQRQTFLRKFEEIFYAIQITKVYSKKDILTMYLNNSYFGNGVWGVQDASKRYFDKNASQLNAAEGATLAAMLRSPSFYNPVEHPQNALDRRNLVLNLMVENHKLTTAQAKAAQKTPLVVTDGYVPKNNYKYPSYFDGVINEAIADGISEDSIMNKGYKIYTNLNQNYQRQMQSVYNQSWLFPAPAADGTQPQSGSIAIDPQTGGVVATVGRRGPNPFRSYSYATMSQRQAGSTMKPLAVYTPALQAGYRYNSMLKDEKISYGPTHYTPSNWNNQYLGEVPMYTALSQSLNTPAVWLLNQIGINKGVKSVERFGINVPKNKQELGLALGDLDVSPYQMARAYCAFANGGYLPQTHFIRKIVDASGNVIVNNSQPQRKRIISGQIANEMTSMMLDVFRDGTGASAKPAGYTIAGKTGGTQVPSSWGNPDGTKDQWIVGYTPDIVLATWIGFANTDAQHFLQNSIGDVANVFKNEMADILPYTAQTPFKVNDAQTIVQNDASDNPTNWWNTLQSKLSGGWDNLKQKANQWYNNIKSLLQH